MLPSNIFQKNKPLCNDLRQQNSRNKVIQKKSVPYTENPEHFIKIPSIDPEKKYLCTSKTTTKKIQNLIRGRGGKMVKTIFNHMKHLAEPLKSPHGILAEGHPVRPVHPDSVHSVRKTRC